MHSMTPEETLAALARVSAIEVETKTIVVDEARIAEFFYLNLELNDLYLKLGYATADEAAQWAEELRQSIIEFEATEKQAEELASMPTEAEIVMADFADRLAARQGTFIPDFKSLFEKKAELDRKLMDPRSPS